LKKRKHEATQQRGLLRQPAWPVGMLPYCSEDTQPLQGKVFFRGVWGEVLNLFKNNNNLLPKIVFILVRRNKR
jgi:hypothetical protein